MKTPIEMGKLYFTEVVIDMGYDWKKAYHIEFTLAPADPSTDLNDIYIDTMKVTNIETGNVVHESTLTLSQVKAIEQAIWSTVNEIKEAGNEHEYDYRT